MTLDQKIEGLLFFKGEPQTLADLARAFGASKSEVAEAITVLVGKLADRGLTLLYKEDTVMLGTKPELGPILETMRKEELAKELSKASLETLTIVLYKGKATRSEIDYIRGVNSGFILRNLLVRGLVEKETDTRDSRRYAYKPTFDLLAYLGVSRLDELPEFASIRAALEATGEEEQPQAIPEETTTVDIPRDETFTDAE